MAWEVEYTETFERAWNRLSDSEQHAIDQRVRLLQEFGPGLGRPCVDRITSSRYQNMKELRVPEGSSEFRILFAFDPRRTSILLILGDKSPNELGSPNWNGWYTEMVPLADELFAQHLYELHEE
jgi:hypothetical protein